MRERIFMILFVLVLGTVWASALVVVDKWTAPRIDAYMKEKMSKKVLEALVIPFEEENAEEVFADNVTCETIGERMLYRSEDGAVASKFVGSGSQGRISGVIAIEKDLETIRGIAIIEQKETPGLGSRVLEANNLASFRGKKMAPVLRIVTSGTASKLNEVDAITGATLTCNALEKILNSEVKAVASLVDRGDK